MIIYKTTVNPFDNVAYKNGLMSWFTKYGDAAVEYTMIKSSSSVNDSMKVLHNVGPETTVLTSAVTVSFSWQYVTIENNIIILPVTTLSTTITHESVEIFNNSDLVNGNVDHRHIYPIGDNYAKGLNVQYGFIIFEVAESISSFFVTLENQVEFSVAKGDFWGSSINSGKTITTHYIIM